MSTTYIADNRTLAEVEKAHVVQVLERAPTLDDAAKILDINIATLYRKRKRWGLVPEDPHESRRKSSN